MVFSSTTASETDGRRKSSPLVNRKAFETVTLLGRLPEAWKTEALNQNPEATKVLATMYGKFVNRAFLVAFLLKTLYRQS